MIIEALVMMALALGLIIVTAYLLGEYRGSSGLYEPVPTYLPHERYIAEEAIHLDEPVVVDLVSTGTIMQVHSVVETAEHNETLLARYRREALVADKRLRAVVAMLTMPRRPSAKAIAEAKIEVKGREVAAVPASLLEDHS